MLSILKEVPDKKKVTNLSQLGEEMAAAVLETSGTENVSMNKCYENYILVDTGANLTNKKFGRDLESVIKRAKDAGNQILFSI